MTGEVLTFPTKRRRAYPQGRWPGARNPPENCVFLDSARRMADPPPFPVRALLTMLLCMQEGDARWQMQKFIDEEIERRPDIQEFADAKEWLSRLPFRPARPKG